jgi:colicin import membrane protein
VKDLPEDAIARLYAVPLGAFTRERDALAATLAKNDRAAEARAVRQLRRPSAPLWATNQLAHAEADRLEAFLDGVAEVRKTQLRDPRAAAEGLARQRRELQQLVRRAGELLMKQGSRATPDAVRRISDTLLGAAVDRQHADELRHGRLTRELAAPGFEVLTGGRADHLQLVRGGKVGSAGGDRARQQSGEPQRRAADPKAEAARQRRDAARERAETEREQKEAATRERQEAAARQREETAARKRQAAEAQQREMAERRAAVEQADQEAKELNARLAAARQRLAEARRLAKSTSRRRPTS